MIGWLADWLDSRVGELPENGRETGPARKQSETDETTNHFVEFWLPRGSRAVTGRLAEWLTG